MEVVAQIIKLLNSNSYLVFHNRDTSYVDYYLSYYKEFHQEEFSIALKMVLSTKPCLNVN